METIQLATTLRENELLIGEIYQVCQKLFGSHEKEFRNLQLEEEGHAFLLEEMISDMEKDPSNWRLGKVSLVTAKFINQRLRENLEEIKSGSVAPKYAITFAISMELSHSEKDFSRVFVCDNDRFTEAFKKLEEGFKDHYKRLLEIEKDLLETGKLGFENLKGSN